MDTNTWNIELVTLLDKIRLNAYVMSEKHRKRFIMFTSWSKYFDLPIIICSVFSSSFSSLGTIPLQQSNLITTSISMFIAVLTSIKLYLNLSSNINDEIALSKDFYILSVSIFKIIKLNEQDRKVDPLDFLNSNYNQYIKLIEQSSLLQHNIKKDELINIDMKKYIDDSSRTISSRSSDSDNSTNIIITTSTEI
jgi:hypothetical protein